VEDIRLARMIKSEGFKTAVLLGNNDIYCRMYQRLDNAVLGFSRNIHEYFGGHRVVMLSFWFIVCFGPFIVFYSLDLKFLGLFAVLVITNRLFVAVSSRQHILGSVLLHPFQMINFTAIVFYNIFRRMKKETTWKGRKIKL
jgi:chlorobactene glucosyltransferase